MEYGKHSKQTLSPKILKYSILVMLALSAIVVSSYIMAGWLMHPVGDDYGSITAYHTGGLHWLSSLLPTVIHGGGRYGQTLLAVTFYGAFGQRVLGLTALMSVGLFLLASYAALLATQKSRQPGSALNHRYAVGGAMLLFLFYSMISIAFPWIRGGIDSSFQDFLWFPGFLTYTLPFELLVIMLSLCTLHMKRINKNTLWLIPVGIVALFIGTFSEITPLVYAELLFLIGLYQLKLKGFTVSSLKSLVVRGRLYLTVAVGLLLGLALNYSSSATTQRRAIFNEQATTTEIIAHALRSTKEYFSTYLWHATTHIHSALAFTVLGGIILGLAINQQLTASKAAPIRISKLALFWVLSFVMAGSSVFICFVTVFKGYGIHSYLVPRFEIVYNIWISLCLINTGFIIAGLLVQLFKKRSTVTYIPYVYALLALLIVVNIPHTIHQAANRFKIVAVFSAEWETQNAALLNDAAHHDSTVTVPVIDIGDSYNFNCTSSSTDDWLGVVKEQYYHIDHICSTPINAEPLQ